jgi:hypothetical protein
VLDDTARVEPTITAEVTSRSRTTRAMTGGREPERTGRIGIFSWNANGEAASASG